MLCKGVYFGGVGFGSLGFWGVFGVVLGIIFGFSDCGVVCLFIF